MGLSTFFSKLVSRRLYTAPAANVLDTTGKKIKKKKKGKAREENGETRGARARMR